MSNGNNGSEIVFLKTMIRAALTRPQMYTVGGTFREVISFLNGYYAGHHPQASVWGEFIDFVGTKQSVESHSDSVIFQEFESLYKENSISKLSEWAKEFELSLK